MELIENGAQQIPHAVIVWGGSEEDRNADAYELARAIVCSAPEDRPCQKCPHCLKSARGIHPDIMIVDRLADKQNILVDQIRSVREDAVVLPNEAEKKAYIIRHAGLMNQQAQNAFLKVLEEPPGSASFILAAENPGSLLPTVRSRCVERMSRRQDVTIPDGKLVTAFEEALSGGAVKLNALSYQLEKLDRNSFLDFIDGAAALLIRRLRDAMAGGKSDLGAEYLMKGIEVFARAKQYYYSNVGLVHISGMICAELMPTGK